MIGLILAVVVAVGAQDVNQTGDAIGAAFAVLDEQHFEVAISLVDASTENFDQGQSEASTRLGYCLGLLSPIASDLSTKILHREMALVAAVDQNSRAAAFDAARTTAHDQSITLARHRAVLMAREGSCMNIPAYTQQRAKVLNLHDRVMQVLGVIVGQPSSTDQP